VFSAHDAAPVPRAQRLQTARRELEALDAALAAFAEQRGLPLASGTGWAPGQLGLV
jgi:hypothetical protein